MNNTGVGIFLKLINFEEECVKGISSGRDFFIDIEFDMSKLDGNEILLADTIYSARRYGPQKNENDEVQKFRYQCNCGLKYGNDSLGEVCPKCHHPVKKKDFTLDITGWIPLQQKVLTPVGAFMLSKAIGNTASGGKKKAADGKKTKKGKSKWGKLKAGQKPFGKFDIVQLYDRFEEIISPHIKSKKRLKFLLDNKEKLFTDKFPVISRRLRRFMITYNGDVKQIQADEISTTYTKIISATQSMTLLNTPEIYRRTLSAMTDEIEVIYKKLEFELAADKYKVLKGEIYSTRNPFSGRMLVEPDIALKCGRGDVCRISYDAFRTYHKTDIMNILIDDYKFTFIEADRFTDIDFILTQDEKDILDDILESDDWWIMTNREPSIDFSAICALEILGLCDENILYINPMVCGEFRADFDGDTFSCYVVPNPLKARLKVSMNPRAHSVWWDRSLNDAYNTINDQVVITHLILGDGNVELL